MFSLSALRSLTTAVSCSRALPTPRHFSATSGKKVAVVLAGCGVYDGAEIAESVSTLLSLSRRGAQAQCFAPDREQAHVVNHLTGEEMNEKRSIIVEAARIARGDVKDLASLDASAYDALIFPGGFGAAKNLSSFAFEGDKYTVKEDVESVVKAFHSAGKPIGMCCISPVIAAKVLKGCSVTIGNDTDVAGAIESVGAQHVSKDVHQAHVDAANKLVTAPAYMYGDAPVHEVAEGIDRMVEEVLSLA
eukprot:TRINITY_DN1860_c0_g1_i2.p1 TRINITY_DN1860_c0_g1~~TRINITY_DN1860_c0_g1_i2.p1  ORF type:complete len:247 (+),score=74.87 TRINITY_DN1860_c0_g1_i2:41-781(+)